MYTLAADTALRRSGASARAHFKDAIGAFASRAAKADGGKAFWNVNTDAQSLAKVVALYVAHNSRTASPKYLLGESYGGFRSAKVARVLQADQGIVVSGIVMVSPMIEASYTFGGQQGPFSAALAFPSIVASELERTKKFSAEALAEAERLTKRLEFVIDQREKYWQSDRAYADMMERDRDEARAIATALLAVAVSQPARADDQAIGVDHPGEGDDVVSDESGSHPSERIGHACVEGRRVRCWGRERDHRAGGPVRDHAVFP